MLMKKLVPSYKLTFDLFAPTGKMIRSWSEDGHSWVRNAYNYFFAAVSDAPGDGVDNFGAGFMGAKNTSGTVYRDTGKSQDREAVGVPGTSGMVNNATSSLFGLVLGSGDTAFDIDDFALSALIAHGTGAGQLSYAAQVAPVLDYSAKIWKASHIRTFSNLSGAQVDVKEMGFIRKQMIFSTSTYFLMARDVLAAVIEIDPLAVLQVTVDITHDFSDID